ncbi:hypothetical protein HNY73_012435 [Argiope bruennichi]|uniref:Uncharacterized protein n=1 Tax=Argiope bruennichi TaxID=94029 RepID=A0A8T0EWZ8_ARGBR|nr:hypothetical protein HNY73_012435 [Argiope bruennichi]
MFKTFWALGDLQRQRQYVKDCMQTLAPKVERVTLIATRIRDQRGKHQKHNKIEVTLVESVHKHINSIPKIPRHYCRQDTSRVYIEGGKSIADLHRDYKKEREIEGKKCATYDQYFQIFKTYNISFFQPKKDQCSLCRQYENSPKSDALTEKYEQHIIEKDLSRMEKQADKENSDAETAVAVYDLQAVLSVPNCLVSDFYYLSKVASYNFTIFNIKKDEMFCYFWNETQGHRGPVEIGTSVWKYLSYLDAQRDTGIPIPAISEMSVIMFKKSEPLKIYGKISYGDAQFQIVVDLEMKKTRKSVSPTFPDYEQAYPTPFKVAKKNKGEATGCVKKWPYSSTVFRFL